jgi:hypothetical protein
VADDGVLARSVFTAPINGPSGSTNVQIVSDTPLAINTTSQTVYVIAAGKTFTLTQIEAGAEGDPTENGSRVDVLYRDAAAVEHLISRVYVLGFGQFLIFPNAAVARDGTPLVGATTEAIILRRTRLSGGFLEVDAVARGYEV